MVIRISLKFFMFFFVFSKCLENVIVFYIWFLEKFGKLEKYLKKDIIINVLKRIRDVEKRKKIWESKWVMLMFCFVLNYYLWIIFLEMVFGKLKVKMFEW